MSNSEPTAPLEYGSPHWTLDSSVVQPFKCKKYDFERHKVTDNEGIKIFKCNICDYETVQSCHLK